MREIKFRIWDKDAREMREIDLYWFEESMIRRWPDGGPFAFAGNCELMQFTGLTDRSGKEIYEGDIVHSRFGTGWVECFPGEWRVQSFTGWFALPTEELEIIGNVYENHELLEQK